MNFKEMEDLRNQKVNFVATFVKTHNSFLLAVNNKSYRLKEDQFIELHNAITTALAERVIEEKKL